jgi:hypothetical protein
MRTHLTRLVPLIALLTFLMASVQSTPANPPRNPPFEGLSPGFWKNHVEAWPLGWDINGDYGYVYAPTDKITVDFFNVPASLANYTYLQALSFRGGPTLDAAKAILLRSAVAALLNSVAHPGESDGPIELVYPLHTYEVIYGTSLMLGSNNRSEILAFAALLDEYNNLGVIDD